MALHLSYKEIISTIHMKNKKQKNLTKVILIIILCITIISVGIIMLVNHFYPVQHLDIVFNYSEIYDLEPELILAVIHAESRFRESVVSRAGASGLMQIMPDTAYWLAERIGLSDFDYSQIFAPEINIHLGSYYLYTLIMHFGDIETALAAYNAGRGNVSRWLNNPDYSSDGKTLDYIPFPETREYVRRVMENKRVYYIILRVLSTF